VGEYSRAAADAYGRLFDTALDVEFDEGGLVDRFR
jgi:hypothetical protein